MWNLFKKKKQHPAIWHLHSMSDDTITVHGAFDFYVKLEPDKTDLERVKFYLNHLIQVLNENWGYEIDIELSKQYGEKMYATRIAAINAITDVASITSVTDKKLNYLNSQGYIVERHWNSNSNVWE